MKKLPADLRGGHPIEVCCTCDINGTLSVECRVYGTDHKLSMQFHRQAGLSDGDVSRWKSIVTKSQSYGQFEKRLEETFG